MSQSPRHVSIIEVGPRDGLQSEPEILPTATKIEFIRRAVDAGIRDAWLAFLDRVTPP